MTTKSHQPESVAETREPVAPPPAEPAVEDKPAA